MKPISPVLPGQNCKETIIAEHQDEYENLPAVILGDGSVITRWHLTFRERLGLLFKGTFYLTVLTFGGRLNPLHLSTEQPKIEWETPHGK